MRVVTVLLHTVAGKTFLANTNYCHSQIFFARRSKCLAASEAHKQWKWSPLHSLQSGCVDGRHLAESSSWMEQCLCNMLVNVGDCTDINCTRRLTVHTVHPKCISCPEHFFHHCIYFNLTIRRSSVSCRLSYWTDQRQKPTNSLWYLQAIN